MTIPTKDEEDFDLYISVGNPNLINEIEELDKLVKAILSGKYNVSHPKLTLCYSLQARVISALCTVTDGSGPTDDTCLTKT